MANLVKLKVRATDFGIELPGLTFLQVLEADLAVLQKLETTVKWLSFVAQSIWMTTGTVFWCSSSDTPVDESETWDWMTLDEADDLRAGHYEFRKTSGQVAKPFTRIACKSDVSATNDSQLDKSRVFKRQVSARDGDQCILTTYIQGLRASHIVPKRLGDAVTRQIFLDRGGSTSSDRWSPENGITLFIPIDGPFDRFSGSLYPVGPPNRYRFHAFDARHQVQQKLSADGTVSYDMHQQECTLSP